jgi:phosphatidylglycerophosphatase A
MKILTNIFVSLFYSGYLKKWPGTFASLLSIVLLFPIIKLNIISIEIFILVFILIFILSLFFINQFSKLSKTHDSGIIVIDEFLGIYLIFIFYDFIYFINSYLTIFLIFILFRFFDILKIFPANIIDKRMKNSLGVLLDDLIAAVYTITILYLFNVYT